MRTWRFGDCVPAEALVPATDGRMPCRQASGIDRRMAARFTAGVAEDDILFAGHDFATGPLAEQLAGFLNVARVRAIVAKSFALVFERAATKGAFALISNPDAVNAYEYSEHAPADDWLVKFILEAGPDATRRTPQVELDIEHGRLVIDGTAFSFEPPEYQI